MVAGTVGAALAPVEALAQARPAPTDAVKQSSMFVGHVPAATFCDVVEPAQPSTKPPLVLVHGGSHTGTCYLSTVDGRPGWAHYFAARGHKVVVPDWPGCGRSGVIPYGKLTGEVVCAGLANVIQALGTPVILFTHSMSGPYGWKLVEMVGDRIAKLVAVAPGPPGNIQPPVKIINQTPDYVEVQRATVMKLSMTEPFIPLLPWVKVKLVGSSAHFPAELVEQYAATLQAVPPRLMIQRVNIGNSQLKVEKLDAFRNKRVLVVVGTDDAVHPVELERSIADWFSKNGAKADFLPLGEHGIKGNGHMVMLERNSDQVAEAIARWVDAA